MIEGSPFTFREAVLTSLLVHAALFIYVLLFPETFAARQSLFQVLAEDSNTPIPATFLQPSEVEQEVALGDAGTQRRSDPRPADAPEPANEAPYAQGNTRNRFVAPPVPENVPPAPSPGSDPSGGEPESQSPAEAGQPGAAGGQTESGSLVAGGAAAGQPVPPARQPPGSAQRRQGSLRDALGRMGAGLAGGPQLKYDNPVGGLSGPSGGLSFDTPGYDWGPYARKIYWIIWTNWTRGWPPAAYAGLTGVVTVRFRIHRDGTLSGITVEEPSGTEAFDICATLALEASNPLPELPDDFPKDSEGITARFYYNIDPN